MAQDRVYGFADFITGGATVPELVEQAIVVGVGVSDVRYDSKADCFGVELFGGCSSADATTAAVAGMIGDLLGFGGWATGKCRLDCRRITGDERLVQFVALDCGAQALARAHVGVGQALRNLPPPRSSLHSLHFVSRRTRKTTISRSSACSFGAAFSRSNSRTLAELDCVWREPGVPAGGGVEERVALRLLPAGIGMGLRDSPDTAPMLPGRRLRHGASCCSGEGSLRECHHIQ
jgi:hypothetical protein